MPAKSLSRQLHVCFTCLFFSSSSHSSLLFSLCFRRLGGGLAGATLQVLLLAAGLLWLGSFRFCWNHTDHGACGVLLFALGPGTGREGITLVDRFDIKYSYEIRGKWEGGREDRVFVSI